MTRRAFWPAAAGLMACALLPLAAAPVVPPLRDIRKGAIESPTEKLFAAGAPLPAAPGPGFVNPRVEPGKVKWHPSFADACAAAARSGKPVLLFQMMGRLDQQFC